MSDSTPPADDQAAATRIALENVRLAAENVLLREDAAHTDPGGQPADLPTIEAYWRYTAARKVGSTNYWGLPVLMAEYDRLRAENERLAEEMNKFSGGWEARVSSRARLRAERDAAIASVAAVRLAADGWQEMLDRGETTAASPGDAVLCGVVARLGAVLDGPVEAPAPEPVDDHVAVWIKAARDQQNPDGTAWDLGRWNVLDDLLDDYRLHRVTGTPLDRHACEGQYCCADEGAPSAVSVGPAEAAEPTCGHSLEDGDITRFCVRTDSHDATRAQPHRDGTGVGWWGGDVHTIRPVAEAAEPTTPAMTAPQILARLSELDAQAEANPDPRPIGDPVQMVGRYPVRAADAGTPEPAHDGDTCAETDQALDDAHGDLNTITEYLDRNGVSVGLYRTVDGLNYRIGIEALIEKRLAAGSVTTTPADPDPMLTTAAVEPLRQALIDAYRRNDLIPAGFVVEALVQAVVNANWRPARTVETALIGTYADPEFVAHQDHKHPVDGCGYCPTDFEEPTDA